MSNEQATQVATETSAGFTLAPISEEALQALGDAWTLDEADDDPEREDDLTSSSYAPPVVPHVLRMRSRRRPLAARTPYHLRYVCNRVPNALPKLSRRCVKATRVNLFHARCTVPGPPVASHQTFRDASKWTVVMLRTRTRMTTKVSQHMGTPPRAAAGVTHPSHNGGALATPSVTRSNWRHMLRAST